MTKETIIEVTKSSRGKTMLKVDSFKFFLEKKNREGLHYWRCVRSLCTAKFFTDEALNLVSHEVNSFEHNHVLSRTKLVKRLVIKEIKKVVALKGETMPTGELKKYALNYLNQAFASTLKPAEMSSVKKAIHNYCRYFRCPKNMAAGIPSPDGSQDKATTTQGHNELHRLKICKAVEQGMYYDYFVDQIAVTSSSESDADSTNEDEKEGETFMESIKTSNEPELDFMDSMENKFTEAMFQGEAELTQNPVLIQPMSSQFSGGTVTTKPEYQESFYRTQGWVQMQEESQPALLQGYESLGQDFAYQQTQQQEDFRPSPPGSAFSFVGSSTLPLLIPRLEPMSVVNERVIDLPSEEYVTREVALDEDEDEKFCMGLVPLFQRLSISDKSMIKAQIHQLVTWKLKSGPF